MAHVNFHDANAYAGWAGKQLPTEAQWEMAARSTESRRFPWGNEPARWSRPRTSRQIDNVMSFPEDVSVYGVFDMAGNVQEWTKDWYDSKYFQQIAKATVENPIGPDHSPALERATRRRQRRFENLDALVPRGHALRKTTVLHRLPMRAFRRRPHGPSGIRFIPGRAARYIRRRMQATVSPIPF